MAISPFIIINTVLFAIAISVIDTKADIPSSADFLPFTNFYTFINKNDIPPDLLAISANPPVSKDNKNISFIPVKPLYIACINDITVKFP